MDIYIFIILTAQVITVFVQGASELYCDQSYLGRSGSGVITSYNFPFDYRHNLNCKHSIILNIPTEGSKIVCLTFYRFQLESSTPFCSFDYLKLDYVHLKYCGTGQWQYAETASPNSNVWSRNFCFTVKETRSFDITFSTDNNIHAPGFYATYHIYEGTNQNDLTPSPGQAPCGGDQWTCFNRKCISQSKLCDGNNDCLDGSDESYAHARCGGENVLACDFSSDGASDGYCEFTHEGWFRTKERNSPYGPEGDHTNGTDGHYVYSDVNQGSAYLLSPELTLPPNRTHCLSFWYYIYGSPADAQLHLYVARDQAYSRPEWSLTYAPEDQWVKGQVVVRSNAVLQVIFAAELGNSFSGVGLDDISFMEGNCHSNDLSCNFESSLCGWSPTSDIRHLHGVLHGDLTWRRHNQLLAPVGPFYDHSSRDGGGYYLYLNYSSSPSNQRALITSQTVSSFPGTSYCLHFWYYMVGLSADCCQLRVKVHRADDVMTREVWSQRGSIRNKWEQATVPLRFDDPFQLVLEGMVFSGSRGEIGIDEVSLEVGSCSSHIVTTTTTAPPLIPCSSQNEFTCQNGRCIGQTQVCDGVNDCGDLSDEGSLANCVAGASSTTPVILVCTDEEFGCHDGSACVSADMRCDGVMNCADGSDEDTSLDKCPVSVQSRSGGLGTGAIVGIAIGAALCLIIIILSALLGRRRRKSRPRQTRHPRQSGSAGAISTISTNTATETVTGSNTLERHMGMLASMREPMQMVIQPPPYTERNGSLPSNPGPSTSAATPDAELPPDEPPPPYDAVLKEHSTQRMAGLVGGASGGGDTAGETSATTYNSSRPAPSVTSSHSHDNLSVATSGSVAQHSRENSIASINSQLGGYPHSNLSSPSPLNPLLSSTPVVHTDTLNSTRSMSTGSEHIYEEPFTLPRSSSAAPVTLYTPSYSSQPSEEGPQLPDRPPLKPLSMYTQQRAPPTHQPHQSHPQRIRLGTTSLQTRGRPQHSPQQNSSATLASPPITENTGPYPSRSQLGGYERLNPPDVPPAPSHYDKAITPANSSYISQGLGDFNENRQPQSTRGSKRGRKDGERNRGSSRRSRQRQSGQSGNRREEEPPGQTLPPPQAYYMSTTVPHDLPPSNLPQSHQRHYPPSHPYPSSNIPSSSQYIPQTRQGQPYPNPHSRPQASQQYPLSYPQMQPQNSMCGRLHYPAGNSNLNSPPSQNIPMHNVVPQDRIFLSPIGSSSTDPCHPRMDSTESFGGCSTSPLMANSSHDGSEDLDILNPTSV